MVREMAAVLIGEADFEVNKDLIGWHAWENLDLCYSPGYWIPASLLQAAPGFGAALMPLAKVPNLPVFYGNPSLDRQVYSESLTCLCRSREDGSRIKGISILPPGWHEPHYFEFKRCFRYREPGDPEYYWRIISCEADVAWLKGCWDAQLELSKWFSINPSVHQS
jgi:hypothetical protein